MKLELPAKLPGTVIFDLAEIQAREEGGDNVLGPTFKLLTSLVGEDQLATIRETVARKGTPADEVPTLLVKLLGQAIEAYGVDTGKS